MLANRYPSQEEIEEGLSPKEGALSYRETLLLAIKTTELLLREPVQVQRVSGSVLLDNAGGHLLPHFPIRDLHINGQVVLDIDVDNQQGIIYADLSPTNYQVDYEIGHREREVPAVIKALITTLCRYLYSGNRDILPEIVELVGIGRELRRRAQEERNGYQIDRESPREGFSRDSSCGHDPGY